MTSPTSAGPSATPLPSGTRLLRWSVAAPLSAVAGVGSALLGVLADLPVLGVAGAALAAVPAVLAARGVPALHAEQVHARSRAERAERALAGAETSLGRSERALAQANEALVLADRALAARAAEHAVAALQEAPVTVDLVQHASVASARVATSAAAAAPETDARVDTDELQRIWDLGEAARSRTGRGRRVRTGAEVDALPDRPRNVAGHRRRAGHRA